MGPISTLRAKIALHDVAEVIIADPSLSTRVRRDIAEGCARSGVELRTVPSLTELVRGDGKLRYLRKLHVTELLRREPMAIDESQICAFLRGRRVMVTGAGGSIGSELCRQVLKLGAGSLLLVERAENALHDISLELRECHPEIPTTAALADVKHVPKMIELFQRFRPQIIFHAAAYKHVPILESHPREAVLNNVVATRRLAQVAKRFGVETFVFISTDKAVKPKNVMGATKKICEMYIAALNRTHEQNGEATTTCRTRFLMVRFGNVLGSAGSVIPRFLHQIENGDPVTITDPEMSRFFMTVPEAVGLVLQSAALKNSGDAFILDMGDPVKIGDLADDLVVSLGLSPSEVPRKYVGLRPGEKDHEVLWDGEEEDVFVAEHQRIFAIRQRPRSLAEMERLVNHLEALALRGEAARLLERIHQAVPSFTPDYSQPVAGPPEAGDQHRPLVVENGEAKVAGNVRATRVSELP
jgi:FlaA1/EpsC-like NDP-sugar epimerase